ncbi:hypothetical protein EOA75_09640 [Mesorhizobium sp. M1A.F.Ca.IN.022.07.1.1]|uniref:TniQ family protein n=1 Tax=unclassified Mesorhizobium TaxID=325217 RepID=UPI000FCB5B85|nr:MULTISPECIES: TniQ family protein [unclassified Mesorhizobium]RUV95190.1 hypothetical protein EOA75_09640 [Mesorhizobium sp. M1A.F.Ca.IN.022.07.1.1]RWM64913.1 MAG: hypothetical protein EOR82_31515 [Mesorhizobium sp.]RWM89179.1 MAG: hypothetical protein EOR86_29960 [Mesorhizobium sp.]TIS63905.1 MAG: hypothetical protein E5X11_09610 [Mesorhizobium sp.]TJV54525.1 MAG: hypothetical protein E5X82_31455 [Mesorhizobium sp.]
MIRELSCTGPLSVILKPVPDELLSSWITRHADFYGVPPLTMLRHAIPEATSLRQTGTNLGPTAAFHIARLFRSQSSTILAITTSGFPQSAGRLVAPRVIQCCIACSEQNRLRGAATAVQRSWIEGWRITCPVGRQRQQETREGAAAVASTSSPFEDLWVARSSSISRWGEHLSVGIANRYRPITAHQTMPKALPSSGIDTPLDHPWRRRSRFR